MASSIAWTTGPWAAMVFGVGCGTVLATAILAGRLTAAGEPSGWVLQLVGTVLCLELVISPFVLLTSQQFTPEWLAAAVDPTAELLGSLIVMEAGAIALWVGVVTARKSRATVPGTGEPRPHPSFLLISLGLTGSIVAAVIRIQSVGGIDRMFAADTFEDRRVLTAGQGVVEVLAYGGLVAVVLLAIRIAADRRRAGGMAVMASSCIVACVPFVAAGQRGIAIGAMALPYFAHQLVARRTPRLLFWSMPLAVVLLVGDSMTGAVRNNLATDQPLFQDVAEIGDRGVPRTFNHSELLAVLRELKADRTELPGTLVPGLLNWRPRQLFPEKELTTGPVLATMLAPEWVGADGLHRSSYTTGPVVELYYASGLAAVVIGMFLLGILVRRVADIRARFLLGEMRAVAFVFAAYMVGWNIWIDDLGGTVNKCAIMLGWIVALSITGAVMNGASTSTASKQSFQGSHAG